jgi:ATP-dependent DNA ligase
MNAPLVSDHEFMSADFGSTGNRAISGRTLYRAVVDADLEGIVAKRLDDAYRTKLARWHKVLNRGYSQRRGRAEWFRERRGPHAGRR